MYDIAEETELQIRTSSAYVCAGGVPRAENYTR